MKQRLTKAEKLLLNLVFKIQELRSCDGFRAAGMSECGPIWADEIRAAALYLGKKRWLFHFPEFGVEHGQDANRAGV